MCYKLIYKALVTDLLTMNLVISQGWFSDQIYGVLSSHADCDWNVFLTVPVFPLKILISLSVLFLTCFFLLSSSLSLSVLLSPTDNHTIKFLCN